MNKIKVLYFTAQWCGPCKAFGPILKSVAENELKDEVVLEKIDGDDEPEKVRVYGVKAFPTIVMVKEDKELGRHAGLVAKAKLLEIMTNAISKG